MMRSQQMKMEVCLRPNARPISCNESPTFQRRQISVRYAAETSTRFPCAINTTSCGPFSLRMVLHRTSMLDRFMRRPIVRGSCHCQPGKRRDRCNRGDREGHWTYRRLGAVHIHAQDRTGVDVGEQSSAPDDPSAGNDLVEPCFVVSADLP